MNGLITKRFFVLPILSYYMLKNYDSLFDIGICYYKKLKVK